MEEMEDNLQEDSQENMTPKKNNKGSKTPVLDAFSRDITALALEGKLDPVIGREEEIDRVIQILGRRKKNNPVLVGEPGVGKTAIAEGIAKKIVERQVSRALFDKRIVALDISSIIAGTKYRGQFEERMKALIEELQENQDVIVFIDELHTIVGAGNSAGALDVSNMLKPALAKGEVQCIGATTIGEYKKSIEKDGALERRFQKIMVEQPSLDETKEILGNIKDSYEFHHNVTYSDEAIDSCVSLANRYISNRFFPDKAIDIMDEVGSRIHLDNISVPNEIIALEERIKEIGEQKNKAIKEQKYEEAANCRDEEKSIEEELELEKEKWLEQNKENKPKVEDSHVEKVLSKMLQIPVSRISEDEGARLAVMDIELKKRVVGQDEAAERVSEAIQRSRSGLNDPKKPIGSFLFMGSTGVGKTELCKTLAEYMFGSEDALIKIDMSEYMEPHSVSKMIGSPPGYVGYEEGGQLAEKVKNNPYSVVLFDEIEKAHPLVSSVLLQVLDEGHITDGLGRKIDFKNTIIIMTSNVGSRELYDMKPVGFDTGVDKDMNTSSIISKALKRVFRPEFINRIDEQIIFNRLNEKDVKKIADIHLKKLFKRIEEQEYFVEVTDSLKNKLVEEGYSEEFGARPLLRAITKYVQNPISKKLLLKEFSKGDTIVIDYNKESKEINVSKKKNKKVQNK